MRIFKGGEVPVGLFQTQKFLLGCCPSPNTASSLVMSDSRLSNSTLPARKDDLPRTWGMHQNPMHGWGLFGAYPRYYVVESRHGLSSMRVLIVKRVCIL